MRGTALLIVERDFMVSHVGVRRVILHYWASLRARGYEVIIGAVTDGKVIASGSWGLNDALHFARAEGNDAPDWDSSRPVPVVHFAWPTRRGPRGGQFSWTSEALELGNFEVTILTNPWLCAEGIPDGPITTGIVYDMIPNLLACNAIDFGQFIDIYDFAKRHDLGYQIYLERAQSISCISEASRKDFSRFYKLSSPAQARVTTDVPFSMTAETRLVTGLASRQKRPRLLLVNILDLRKNFAGAREAILKVMARTPFDVDIVGRERISTGAVQSFLDALAGAGSHVRWFREASDDRLGRLYAGANALLFPSFYEGLGLPILEAQSHGVPVISSTSPSCVEINMNPDLCVSPHDHERMADILDNVLHAKSAPLTGVPLRNRLRAYLDGRSSGFPSGLQHAIPDRLQL